MIKICLKIKNKANNFYYLLIFCLKQCNIDYGKIFLFSNPINSNAETLSSKNIFFEQLNSEELKAYEDSLNGITDDLDFTFTSIKKTISENTIETMILKNNQNIELIDSTYSLTSTLKENKNNVKNYDAYVFAKETFRFNENNGAIKPFSSSSEDSYDDTASVYYVIKLNYDKTNSPHSGIKANSSEFKVVSTNSGVRVAKAVVVQKAWGFAFNINGANLGTKNYNKNINITSPTTGRNYINNFDIPNSTYFNQNTTGQCGFGVIMTLQRSVNNRNWEYNTNFLGMNNSFDWSPGSK